MTEVVNEGAILQLERVASAVSAALFAIARSTGGDTKAALAKVSLEAGLLTRFINGGEEVGEVPSSPYASEVPEGYQTILGYYDTVNPEYILAIRDPATAWLKDEAWLQKQASRRKLRVVTVDACRYLKTRGTDESVAYPIDLLRERFG